MKKALTPNTKSARAGAGVHKRGPSKTTHDRKGERKAPQRNGAKTPTRTKNPTHRGSSSGKKTGAHKRTGTRTLPKIKGTTKTGAGAKSAPKAAAGDTEALVSMFGR